MSYDSHLHLDQLDEAAVDPAWDLARVAGVEGALVAGVQEALRVVRQAILVRHPELVASVGFHPWLAARATAPELHAELQALDAALERAQVAQRAGEPLGALARRDAVAVGETGLDRTADWTDTRERQRVAFRAQLELARDRRVPLVLHVVRAHGWALEDLHDVGVSAGGVVHAYSGAPDLVEAYLGLGLHLSFCGTVVDSPKLQEACRRVPGERLLVETDAPAQRPRSWGPGSMPFDALPRVLAGLAEARGERVEQLAQTTAQNARRLWGLAP